MTLIAFAPRSEYADGLSGIITAGDRDLDLAARLEEGGGVILVDDASPEVPALSMFAPLEQVPVPKGAKLPDGQDREDLVYGGQPVKDLKRDATSRGLSGVGSASGADLVVALERHDELTAIASQQDADGLDGPRVTIPTTITDLVASAAASKEG